METQKDPILLTVHRLTLNGWPQVWRHIPRVARNYWNFRDELLIEGDLLMKGERIIIPTSCRDSILVYLHRSHEGASRSLSLAKMCLLARYGSRRDGLHQMVCDMHWQCEDASRNLTSTWGPCQTMDQNSYGFLPRWFKTEIFNHCRLLLQVPIHLPCCIDSPPKDAEILTRSVFDWRHAAVVMTDNGPPFNSEDFWHFAREFDFKHQMSSLHFHQSNGFIEAMVKKVKPHTRKWMDLQMLKREPYYSYATPQSRKTYHPWQKFYTDGLHKELSYPDVTDLSTSRKSADDYWKSNRRRKNTLTELTEQRMRESWKWKKKFDSFCRSSMVQN